jgi:outer membrane lipopolysaccharide assembly protein LptE/RlpB
MRFIIGFSFLVFLLCGCGYHVGGAADQLPGDIRTLYVKLFDNQTAEAFLENLVTNRVIEKLSRTADLAIVEDPDQADAVLSGVISSYGRGAVAYDRDDEIVEYRSHIGCSSELRQTADGTVLWKGTVYWDEEFSAAADPADEEDAESLAQEAVARRLADQLYARLTQNF